MLLVLDSHVHIGRAGSGNPSAIVLVTSEGMSGPMSGWLLYIDGGDG